MRGVWSALLKQKSMAGSVGRGSSALVWQPPEDQPNYYLFCQRSENSSYHPIANDEQT